MHNFARALETYFAGPPRKRQNAFAQRARVERAKICRLLQAKIACDRDTLDAILTAVPEPEVRRELVEAYIRDYTSPGALLHLKTTPTGQWDGFDFTPLSPKGVAAIKSLLSRPNVRAFEKIVIGLDDALK